MGDSRTKFIQSVSLEMFKSFIGVTQHPDRVFDLQRLSNIAAGIAYNHSNSKAQYERTTEGNKYQNKVFDDISSKCKQEFESKNYLWINGSKLKSEFPHVYSSMVPRHGTTLSPRISDTDMVLWDNATSRVLLVISSKLSFRERGGSIISEMKQIQKIHPNAAMWVVTSDNGSIDKKTGKRILEIRSGKKAYSSLHSAGIRIYTSNPMAITESDGLSGVFNLDDIVDHIRKAFLNKPYAKV